MPVLPRFSFSLWGRAYTCISSGTAHRMAGRGDEQSMEPPLILLVEDDLYLQRVLGRTLERIGYRVATASTVAGALAAIGQELPAVLVLDNNLPDGTGWGVLRQLGRGGI